MPFKSDQQRKAMYAAAEGESTLGIPESVGKEFIAHDSEPFAAGIIFKAGNKILLAKRADNGLWAFPGGHIEAGETPEQAAQRECLEEVGISVNDIGKIGIFNGFVAFVCDLGEEVKPVINNESLGSGWFDIDNLPSPMLSESLPIIARVNEPPNELDIARSMQAEELPSPQHVNNMWLFKLRITGTGTAYRTKLDQYVYREPDNYLNDYFLARCNGLSVIWEHPEKNKLDSKEFSDRVIGSIFIPYIQGDEVWGIAKIYDEEAAKLMIEEKLSTSPTVIFSNEILEDSNIIIDSNTSVLVEGKPSLIDHLAICEIGVWDKGGEPSGVISNNPEVTNMPELENKVEDIKADDDTLGGIPAEHEAEEKKDVSLDEQILAAVKKVLAELGTTKADDDVEDPLKMPDEPQATFADDDKKEESYADSATVADLKKQVAELQRKIPRQRTADEYDQLAAAQIKAEEVYTAFGDSASKCRPMDGETVKGYRIRMAKGLQKHSAKFAKTDLSGLDGEVLAFVEETIYADSMTIAMSPVTTTGGMPRAVVTREGGRERTEWVGGDAGAVFAPFRMKARNLAAVRDQVKH